MGYTHYFNHTEVSEEVWKKILKDCRKLFRSLPEKTDTAGGYHSHGALQIGNWEGVKLLKTLGDKDKILFNGYEDLSHETCLLCRTGSDGFTFCKTARKPYDLMVCSCLIVYTFHSQETMPDLGSDGDWDDWEPALLFVEQTLGAQYIMKFKMEQEL